MKKARVPFLFSLIKKQRRTEKDEGNDE